MAFHTRLAPGEELLLTTPAGTITITSRRGTKLSIDAPPDVMITKYRPDAREAPRCPDCERELTVLGECLHPSDCPGFSFDDTNRS